MAKPRRKRQKSPTRATASIIDATRVPLRGEAEAAGAPQAQLLPNIARFLVDWREIFVAILRILLWHRLDFAMQHQQQTNWCWAAVATSVSLFYDPASTWTQCAVANSELGRTDCCGTGASGPCNVYGFLGSSLTTVGHLDHQTGSTSTFGDVQTEIDAGRPLCARTAWSGGGAHFLAIIGYRIFDEMLAVDDPWYGKSDVSYATFTSSYQGSGSWTHSYFTTA
jgi:Papain-like cysteine protease AvrRpt2